MELQWVAIRVADLRRYGMHEVVSDIEVACLHGREHHLDDRRLRPDQRYRVLEIQNDPLLDRWERNRTRADHESEGAESDDLREHDVTFLEHLRAAALYYE